MLQSPAVLRRSRGSVGAVRFDPSCQEPGMVAAGGQRGQLLGLRDGTTSLDTLMGRQWHQHLPAAPAHLEWHELWFGRQL